jgi:outer membrane receptor for monomeric catechols
LTNNTAFALANRFTKYRANAYATYTFDSGPLKSLAIGGGVNLVGASKIGNGATGFDYLWSDPYYLLTGHLSYTTRIFNQSIKWQVNVKNLLNESDPVATSIGTFREKGIAANPAFYVENNYRYNDPRQIIVSASVAF